MKHTTLAIAILFSLTGPAPVLAEVPAVTVKPLAMEVIPLDVEAATQQALEALPATAAGAEPVQQPSVEATPAAAAEPVVAETPAPAATAAEQAATEMEALPATAAGAEPVQQPSIEAAPAAAAAAIGTAIAAEPAVTEMPVPAAAAAAATAAEQAAAEMETADPAAGAAMVEAPVESAATDADAESSAVGMPGKRPCPKYGMGMMGKGMGPDGKGMGGMKPGCDHRGKMGMQGRHAEVVERLDMIEARMAKIEIMLETLMKRQ